ncbi:YqfO family protein [Moraxella sp. FZLJ2107]|uniref:Nif3-like dinuclear metal center hexameric protein n=1 Tax=unclassified Moraxella TaxID=2685852 RepID=UPI00209C1D72|nr:MULTISPECIES: YqfO family protein [unclassified Moraxella]USZ15871.1 YqfO family protein [Moraxella sp. FZFQ2102]UTO06185.1 YqfO family protein [Moraxella sp. FZLJ2107]UTO23462.1 YqfO family protein [Moraxella sp. FZLJ2109]
MYKIVTYIPETHLEVVKTAMFAAGAGHYGNYECCSWQTLGMGQFRPLDGANPTIGEVGEITRVSEWKVEMMVPENKLCEVVQAYKDAHPYEVPAYEVYQTVDVEGD